MYKPSHESIPYDHDHDHTCRVDVTVIRGVLEFYSETGTEGGYYAVQDEKFMGLPGPNQWRCPRCSRIWDKDRDPDAPPAPSFTYYRDMSGQKSPEGHGYVSGFFGYDEPHDDLPEGSDGRTDSWVHRQNQLSRQCYEHGHAEWEFMYPNGMWSYEGLITLNDGDRLKIFSKDNPEEIVWEGQVDLRHVDSWGDDGGTSGLRVHQKARNVDEVQWLKWFLAGLPCELTRKEKM